MKTLLILRHAKSSWKDNSLDDHDRPLNKRGKRDAPRMGDLLREYDLTPDIILTSSAKRAKSTAKRAAEACGFDGRMIVSRELYAFGALAYFEAIRELPDEINSAMIVGHNPAMEELLDELCDEYLRMPTAALAQVELKIDQWSEIENAPIGKLINLWRPKEL